MSLFFNIFFLLTLIFTITVIHFTNKQVIKQNIILGITLPLNETKNIEVLNILKDYNKNIKILFITSICLSFINLINFKYFSFNLVYFVVLILLNTFITFFIIKKYNLKIKDLKEKNNWTVGEKNIISIDTELSALKNNMVVSKLFFIPIFLLALILLFIGILNIKEIPEIFYLCIINLTFIIAFYILYINTKKSKVKIYSENKEINFTLNKYEKYLFSKLSIVISFIFTIISIIGTIILLNNPINFMFYFIIFILFTFLIPIIIYYYYYKIKKTKEKILILDKNPILVDEDDYWKYGIFYYNPNNKNKLIEQRIGIGMTYNIPFKLNIFINIIVYLLLIFILSIPIFSDIKSIEVYEKNHILNIDFPLYNTKIKKDEINEIIILDKNVKIYTRVNGYSGKEKSVGNFRALINEKEDIYKIFINNYNLEKFILIDLKNDKDILLNGKDISQTDEFIKIIKNFIQ